MSELMPEIVILVDEQDNQIGVEEKLRAHQLGLLHRAFSVFIIRYKNDQLEILMQQRQKDKYHCGGLWTNTCCSHPRVGESIIQAGERRLYEEMGLRAQLQRVGSFSYRAEFSNGLVEHEYDHVLVAKHNGDTVCINLAEVQDYMWLSIGELKQRLSSKPQDFTPWLAGALAVMDNCWEELIND